MSSYFSPNLIKLQDIMPINCSGIIEEKMDYTYTFQGQQKQ